MDELDKTLHIPKKTLADLLLEFKTKYVDAFNWHIKHQALRIEYNWFVIFYISTKWYELIDYVKNQTVTVKKWDITQILKLWDYNMITVIDWTKTTIYDDISSYVAISYYL